MLRPSRREETQRRRYPIGAEPRERAGVHFRVWAPRRRSVHVVIEGGPGAGHGPWRAPLARQEGGYFAGLVAEASTGALYRFQLDDEDTLYPDPASRFQPEGPHGPSQVIDPAAFTWTDAGWDGVELGGQVLYEMHVGTFTREGTWEAAARELAELARLGITTVEMMPVAEFPGRFGWGYDGVDLFAPTRLYGTPDDLRAFVDRAHALGLGVILDVVYNHLGPEGNYLRAFAREYFTDRHANEWGEAIDFDGPGSGPVRELFATNAAYWIDEFHFDGLRLDATQAMHDESRTHILEVIGRRAREAAGRRKVLVTAENEPQNTRLLRPVERGGFGLDAAWNDDFHHTARVAAQGRRPAYFRDYGGTPQELISCCKRGYLYQGQYYAWQRKNRGAPTFGIEPARFIVFLQNHDQVANSAFGERLQRRTSPGRQRALTALLLLAPGTPLLFQGQEFAASAPFLYFADHEPALAAQVRRGRGEFLAQFANVASPEVSAALAPPEAWSTFEACKLDLSERRSHGEVYALHADLLRLRREDSTFAAQGAHGLDGAVLGPEVFVLRYFGSVPGGPDDRLLLINLGADWSLERAPEPLLAPSLHARWQVKWSSEHPRYGGEGLPELHPEAWVIPGHCAVVLQTSESS